MLRITSNEKAVVGGLVSALVVVVAQVQQSGQFTLKEFWAALVAYALTHLGVWSTTNTPTPVDTPVTDSPAPIDPSAQA